MAPARLPNLLIVGVSKAGTTSLFHYLGQHPDICTSDIKELRYFSPLQYGQPLAPLDTYTRHFRSCGEQRYAVEATPGYFHGDRPLAQGLRETCPSARAMVVFRSPVDRCWSFFRFVKSKVRIPKDMTFSAYLDRCEALYAAGTDLDPENGAFSGLGKGCYARWTQAWTEEFGDRFRILFFEDLVTDPRAVLRSTCEWLRIDSGVVDGFSFGADNKTEQYRNPYVQRAALSLNRRGQRLFERHPSLKGSLRRGYYALNRAPADESMSPTERDRLVEFYRPHNARLAGQLEGLGLTLPVSWEPRS